MRDLRPEAERLDLRFHDDLGFRVAVHEEHGARVAGLARLFPAPEVTDPVEELRLIRVGGEAADRSNAAAHLVDLAVEAMRRGARDFVQKPWENERLIAILRPQIELSQALRKGLRLEAENRLEKFNADRECLLSEVERRVVARKVAQLSKTEIDQSGVVGQSVNHDYVAAVDTFGSAEYRRELAKVLVRRALEEALGARLVVEEQEAAVYARANDAVDFADKVLSAMRSGTTRPRAW